MNKRISVLILLFGISAAAAKAEIPGQSRIVRFLSDTPLTDEAVEHLKEMTWLRTLALNSAGISGGAFQRLRQTLPDCTLRFRKDLSAHKTNPSKKCIL